MRVDASTKVIVREPDEMVPGEWDLQGAIQARIRSQPGLSEGELSRWAIRQAEDQEFRRRGALTRAEARRLRALAPFVVAVVLAERRHGKALAAARRAATNLRADRLIGARA